MGDRVPIGTHPGLVSELIDADLPVASLARTETAVAVFLRRTDQEAADVVSANLRNATGGGGSAIAVAFAAGATTATATGSLAGSDFYLRVGAADANSRNLTGWLELVQGGDVTAALTSLARLKAYLGIDDSGNDTLLGNILMGASARIQNRIGRAIVEASISAELHSADVLDERLVLVRQPVTAVSEVRIDGSAIASGSYQRAEASGILYRRDPDEPDKTPDTWPIGSRHISVDYTAGYATIPEDLVNACIQQSAYAWRQSQPGGYRIGDRGTIVEPGGSANYLTGPWAPGVLQTIDGWRRRVVG